jgi:hypothetical protein
LKNLGLSESEQVKFRQEVEELRQRHCLYGFLYSRYSRSDVITPNPEDSHEDDDANVSHLKTTQLFDSKEWEAYLNDMDSEMSNLTLEEALSLPVPLSTISAQWLFELKDCALFMEKVWHPNVKSTQVIYPLCKEDLQVFVRECADRWKELASTVARGTVSFKQMDEISKLQPDPNVLSQSHLTPQLVKGVAKAYKDFRNLQELRHLIGPFVTALRFFSIKEKGPIDSLYDFVDNNLLRNWDSTTLVQIAETGILRLVNEELNIDLERPETRNAMQFVGSLTTKKENRSPLIERLREKDEKDMEAMGKILQGTLLEVYGNSVFKISF